MRIGDIEEVRSGLGQECDYSAGICECVERVFRACRQRGERKGLVRGAVSRLFDFFEIVKGWVGLLSYIQGFFHRPCSHFDLCINIDFNFQSFFFPSIDIKSSLFQRYRLWLNRLLVNLFHDFSKKIFLCISYLVCITCIVGGSVAEGKILARSFYFSDFYTKQQRLFGIHECFVTFTCIYTCYFYRTLYGQGIA
eukprot:TRINITY_DN353_c1_g1_i6.p2 TRINITY_DN353_c1_g1~~TRINITY_DN353_c1_g1_i6.p2  ORF type:complete len:195 (-),score=12.43 TRINITY_DN353_c1_g1_i6:836-1420(-)